MVWYLVLCIVLYVDTTQKFSIYPLLSHSWCFWIALGSLDHSCAPFWKTARLFCSLAQCKIHQSHLSPGKFPVVSYWSFFNWMHWRLPASLQNPWLFSWLLQNKGIDTFLIKKTVLCCMTKNNCNFCNTYLPKSCNSVICINPHFCCERYRKRIQTYDHRNVNK